jgi:hypothetical protein
LHLQIGPVREVRPEGAVKVPVRLEVGAVLSVLCGLAHAGEAARDGVAVGLASAAGTMVGGVGLAAVGYGIGLAAPCEECWDFQRNAMIGASVGVVAGSVGGAALVCPKVGRKTWPAVGAAFGALALGTATILVGAAAESDPVIIGGFVGAAAGAPLAAGIATGFADPTHSRVAILPTLDRGATGLRIAGSF